ncbi:MAG: AraC family transcriptional regulator [Ectothiorhodospiraceae bacterium]|nr:AraC family transcriptional regulator [Ectothiorhodospiraceae bacterium]
MTRIVRPKIERALRFIAANLHQPITVAEVAKAANLSEYHFHRLFHAAVGESVGRFLTRQRLELAALRLAYEADRSITEIGLDAGYSSSSNFSKAFAAYFGCSPSQIRSPGQEHPERVGKVLAQYGKRFRPADLYTVPPGPDASARKQEAARWDACVRFEHSPGFALACLAAPGGYALADIERTWAELIRRTRQLGLCDEEVDAWGAVEDSPQLTAPELCRYRACVPCAPGVALPPPLTRGAFPAGRYAVFQYSGPVADIEQAYRGIYSCWFPEASVSPQDFTPFNHYIADGPQEGSVELEIWFRIRARGDKSNPG